MRFTRLMVLLTISLGVVAGATVWRVARPTIPTQTVHRRPVSHHAIWKFVPATGPALPTFTAMAIPPSLDAFKAGVVPFRHRPFDEGSCCPLLLPFRYEDPQSLGDRSEADALAFLMSSDLDWIPGSYCTRHAYFVFEQEARYLLPFRTEYLPSRIPPLLSSWGATHAVGGVLRRSAQGISGTLEIYNDQGLLAFSKDFAEPRDYFQLLGDMDVAAIDFLGDVPASAALQKHLHERRCEHVESILKVGTAAFVSRSQALRIFGQVLEDDPEFGQVRGWWANQRGWAVDSGADPQAEYLHAQASFAAARPLLDVEPSQCRDLLLARQFPQQIAAAAALVGPDSPVVLAATLKWDLFQQTQDADHVRRALAAAAQYPNNDYLLGNLADVLHELAPIDADLAASVALVEAHNLYVPGTSTKEDADQEVANIAASLGRPAVAVRALDSFGAEEKPWTRAQLADVLVRCGRFDDALQVYDAAEVDRDADGVDLAFTALLAAALKGDDPRVRELRQTWSTEFDRQGAGSVVDLYLEARKGKPFAEQAVMSLADASASHLQHDAIALSALADLSVHQKQMAFDQWRLTAIYPTDRLNWALLDAYSRQGEPFRAEGFFEALGWMYPDDPWVQQAVADWSRRRAKTPSPFHPSARQPSASSRKAPWDGPPCSTRRCCGPGWTCRSARSSTRSKPPAPCTTCCRSALQPTRTPLPCNTSNWSTAASTTSCRRGPAGW